MQFSLIVALLLASSQAMGEQPEYGRDLDSCPALKLNQSRLSALEKDAVENTNLLKNIPGSDTVKIQDQLCKSISKQAIAVDEAIDVLRDCIPIKGAKENIDALSSTQATIYEQSIKFGCHLK